MIRSNELNEQFHQLIEQHKGVLYKIGNAYCRNVDDRQDLLQEMMLQVWKSLPKYNDTFAITTWLYRICLNVSISFYRRNAKRQHFNSPLVEELTLIRDEERHEKHEQLSLLEKFISELNDLDKALMLLYLDDKSYSEISEIMGVSVSNVGTRLGRIKEKLKKRFSHFNS